MTEIERLKSDQVGVGNVGKDVRNDLTGGRVTKPSDQIATTVTKHSDQVYGRVTQSKDPVDRVMPVLDNGEMSAVELMQKLGLKHRAYFRPNYLDPALKRALIGRTIPDKLISSKQKYRKVKR